MNDTLAAIIDLPDDCLGFLTSCRVISFCADGFTSRQLMKNARTEDVYEALSLTFCISYVGTYL